MSSWNDQHRTAIEAVARRFSATGEASDLPDPPITLNGKRVVVNIATVKPQTTNRAKAMPRLRFDKVVVGLMGRLKATLGKIVPDGLTVLLAVTAPIRLPSKTAAALEKKVQALLGRQSAGRDTKRSVHGNRVRIRLLKHKSRAPQLIGFVHNPDSDSLLLLDMTRELLDLIFKTEATSGTVPGADRWLVLISDDGISWLDAYRHVCSQVRGLTEFKKILMVLGDSRVEVLAEA